MASCLVITWYSAHIRNSSAFGLLTKLCVRQCGSEPGCEVVAPATRTYVRTYAYAHTLHHLAWYNYWVVNNILWQKFYLTRAHTHTSYGCHTLTTPILHVLVCMHVCLCKCVCTSMCVCCTEPVVYGILVWQIVLRMHELSYSSKHMTGWSREQ